MPVAQDPVIIIGAGLSGLACAIKLHDAGVPFRILEASESIGGRVQTDQIDGFLLDRGFQVYLDAYPEAGKLLDLEALELRNFEPGAMVFDGQKMHCVMDIFRRPSSLFSSAFSPIGSLMDKMRVAFLRHQIRSSKPSGKEISTEKYLQEFGFSSRIIDTFFRSFYGGIFLENDLRTSSRMFEFTFEMFSRGNATLPAKGMGQIPTQLAARLPEGSISLNASVDAIVDGTLSLVNGSTVKASQIVVATNAEHASEIVPGFASQAPQWRAVTNFYYDAPASPLGGKPIIALNGTGQGRINNVAVVSDVSPSYAPAGRSLVSVSALGLNDTSLEGELLEWFGPQVNEWRHLRTDLIRHALPEQQQMPPGKSLEIDGVILCGDHTVSASIEGAIISGQQAAGRIIEGLPT